jgi:hypothetical protein
MRGSYRGEAPLVRSGAHPTRRPSSCDGGAIREDAARAGHAGIAILLLPSGNQLTPPAAVVVN